MAKCPACLVGFGPGAFDGLALHLCERANESDADHVRWLNQNVTKERTEAADLTPMVVRYFDLGGETLGEWIRARFVSKFFGKVPHPFVVALQHPSREVLSGYVIEHQHFLRQWVRSCAFIIARTDRPDVVRYELDNLNTEFGGDGPERVPHYELLLRMGESIGLERAQVLATPPLPATRRGIDEWNRIASTEHWVSALAAMHSLELIANRELPRFGATLPYFDPGILRGNDITPASQAFLREGYEADVGHSDEALSLVSRYAVELGVVEEVQATFLRSADLFDDYLIARLERADRLGG
jgi:pyrroloquinoline-quinone synthase